MEEKIESKGKGYAIFLPLKVFIITQIVTYLSMFIIYPIIASGLNMSIGSFANIMSILFAINNIIVLIVEWMIIKKRNETEKNKGVNYIKPFIVWFIVLYIPLFLILTLPYLSEMEHQSMHQKFESSYNQNM